MVDWKVTAYTTECSAVDEEVTITVKSDWTTQCTGFAKYGSSRQGSIALLKRSLSGKVNLECKGLQCKQIAEYAARLQDEESMPAPADGAKQ
jgi:hypothetical protein